MNEETKNRILLLGDEAHKLYDEIATKAERLSAIAAEIGELAGITDEDLEKHLMK